MILNQLEINLNEKNKNIFIYLLQHQSNKLSFSLLLSFPHRLCCLHLLLVCSSGTETLFPWDDIRWLTGPISPGKILGCLRSTFRVIIHCIIHQDLAPYTCEFILTLVPAVTSSLTSREPVPGSHTCPFVNTTSVSDTWCVQTFVQNKFILVELCPMILIL